MNRIVVITPDEAAPETLGSCFSNTEVLVARSREAGLALASPPPCDFLFLDVTLLCEDPPGDHQHYRKVLAPFRSAFPSAEIVILSSGALIRETVKAVKAGASTYLTYPLAVEEVELVREGIKDAIKARAVLDHLKDPFWKNDALDRVRTESAAMGEVFTKVRQVAPTRSTVLLTGETGTGKNVLAKLIHDHSNRADRQFISLHCGAVSESLLESELFGHERGAFTGAIRRKLGKFEIADGGTIFLDEIGTISPSMQIKLLQVLQERAFQRVGGETTIEVDVRILAATNMDLRRATEEGTFRRDLYFRLNVFPIEIPPLRDRREDIGLLTGVFLERFNRLYQKEIVDVHPLVAEAFLRYAWPGNVRELESLMERAYILETSPVLTPESFPGELFESADAVGKLPVDISQPLALVRRRAVDNVERIYLKEQLAEHEGRINATARATGITERQLHKLMIKHGLRKEDFRRPRGKSGTRGSDR